jgi:hypothetical protein
LIRKILLLTAIFFCARTAHAQCANVTSCTAASGNAADVQTALNSISLDGTTLTIPVGNVAWGTVGGNGATPVTYNQVHSTTIIGSSVITCSGTPGTAGYTCSDNGGTTIIDHVNHTGTGGQDNPTMVIGTAAGKSFRLSGLTFAQDSSSVISYNGGALQLNGSSQSVRIDHVHFSHIDSLAFSTNGTWSGVFDHNIIEGTSGSGWRDHADCSNNGNVDWAAPTAFGTQNSGWRYYESNIMHSASNDGICGGRMVYRFNTQTAICYNTLTGGLRCATEPLQTHGTGSANPADQRAMRAFEIYGNYFNSPNYLSDTGMEITSSSGLFWGNTFVPTSFPGGCTTSPCGWTSALRVVENRYQGTPYVQTPPPGGWGYCGQAFNGTGSLWDQNNPASTGHRCLDAPGTGQSDLLTGSFPSKIDSVTGIAQWPNQASEPLYEWMDTWTAPNNFTSTGFFGNQAGPVIIGNSDYYIDCSPGSPSGCTSFNGTVGVGHGTLAARPATCTTGVAYWATDQGNWNQSGNGFGQGQLYKCTNIGGVPWSLYYTPLTYPHPLVGGATPTVTVSPSSEAFGNVNVGSSSATQIVTLTNSTASAITISSVTTTGTNLLDFPTTVTTCSGTVAANGGTCTVIKKFSPSIAGVESATLNIAFTGATGSPLTVALSGTGISATGNSYNTAFPATENPISQSGAWISGSAAGSNCGGFSGPCWGDVQTVGGTPGHANGTNASPGCGAPGTDCNDSSSALTGTWGPNQSSCGVVQIGPSLNRNNSFYEVENRLNVTISAASINGYEANYSIHTNNGTIYAGIVRWNGPIGSYTQLTLNNAPPSLTAGDTVCLARNGNTLTHTLNHAGVITTLSSATDSTFLGGSPGIGFFNFNGPLSDNLLFGFSSFSATDTSSGGAVTISPSTENFGSVTVGVTSPGQVATVKNTTAVAITVGTINYTGANPLDFATPSTTCSGTVPASGGSCTITTTFRPGAAGTRTATLNFNYSGGSSGDATVSLSGSGGAPQVGSCAETQTTTPNVSTNVGRKRSATENNSTSDAAIATKPGGVGAICHAIP